MLIEKRMNLDDLKCHMSNTEIISDEDAIEMRALLVEEFDGADTRDVPQDDWDKMLENL